MIEAARSITVQDFIPSPRLRSYIKKYYLIEGDFGENTSDIFFADGCPEIVFNLDVAFYRDGEKEHWAKVIGQIIDPLQVRAKGKGKSFGIWFYPHGFTMISSVPAKDLTGRAIALDTIFDKEFIDAQECSVSHRYLQKIFLERVGMRPKQFLRVLRFQRALRYLNARPESKLTTIAYEAGYFDQPHFVKEFKRFTGLLPSQYRLANHPINQYFLTS